ncbi:MAG TPA: hypothetical protein ENK65_03225 [Helicobacteraceae bacterium]|nr:hypothetical protein [Helicobacteraceae bacterium]
MQYLPIPFIILVLFFTGCGSTPKPKVDTHVTLTPAKTIELYGQKLTPSQALASKAFQVREIPVTLKPNVQYMGIEQKSGFTFTIAPLLQYTFDTDYIILAADTYTLLPLTDDAVFEKHIIGQIKEMDRIYANLSRDTVTLAPTQEILTQFKATPTKSMTFSVKSLHFNENFKASNKYTINAQDLNVTFSLYDPAYSKPIVNETLTTRDEPQNNELLIQAIASSDDAYYQKLLEDKTDFILPQHSIVNMPEDADLRYAIEKHQVYFKTGKYKTKNGQYKIIIPDEKIQFDNSNANVQGTHSIKTKQNKKRLKKATDIPDHDNFIDFSEGVE